MSFYSVNPVADTLSLNDDECERNRQLVKFIRNSIRKSDEQAISFAKFMNFALYHPIFGYYSSAAQVFGSEGDFTTAPELGSLFGKLLSVKLADLFEYGKVPARIYEFGAGTGKLAVQVLNELDTLGHEVHEYVIMEISDRLKRTQQRTIFSSLPGKATKVRWCDRLPADGINGVVIANEVLDAMPVELFRLDNGKLLQAFVVESEDDLQLKFRAECHTDFQRAFELLEMPEIQGIYTSELHCQAESWLNDVMSALQHGSILIADYGFPQHEYYHADRREGTLMCHRRHYSLHDPLAYIGCQDITSHLNFSRLAKLAECAGLELNGFTTLAGFIVDLGVGELDMDAIPFEEQNSLARQLNMLTSPAEMGEIFKVMEITSGINPGEAGFRTLDHAHRL